MCCAALGCNVLKAIVLLSNSLRLYLCRIAILSQCDISFTRKGGVGYSFQQIKPGGITQKFFQKFRTKDIIIFALIIKIIFIFIYFEHKGLFEYESFFKKCPKGRGLQSVRGLYYNRAKALKAQALARSNFSLTRRLRGASKSERIYVQAACINVEQ